MATTPESYLLCHHKAPPQTGDSFAALGRKALTVNRPTKEQGNEIEFFHGSFPGIDRKKIKREIASLVRKKSVSRGIFVSRSGPFMIVFH